MAQNAVYLGLLVVIIVIVGSSGQGSVLCPPYQQSSDCPKPLECRPSCAHPNGTEGCLAVCDKPGCICQDDYVLNSAGECVHPSKCPGFKCPANSTLFECAKLKGCRPSCARPQGAEVCPAVCVIDCVCDTGYLLNDNEDCVLESQCSK